MKLTATLTLLFGLLVAASGCTTKSDGDGEGEGEADPGIPVADAGSDQTLPFDGAVQLNGTGSYDPEGEPLTYAWSFDYIPDGSGLIEGTGGPNPNNSTEAATPSFVPDATGTYVIRLTVNDGSYDSVPDYVVITIQEPETRPVADAGPDQAVDVGAGVSLDGSRSYDPDGLPLTYDWTVVQSPDGSGVTTDTLSGATSTAPSFTASIKGPYILNLVVSNGLVSSEPDSVNITAAGDDGQPVANAGPDIAGYDCTYVQLDASASVDPDGDPLTYFWGVQSVPAGSSVTEDDLSDRTAAQPTLYADISGIYELTVTVYDGNSWAVPDTVLLNLAERTYNSPPIVYIADYPTVAAGTVECEESGYGYDCDECNNQTIQLQDYVTITDPDNDPYTIFWEITSGNGTITDPTALDTPIILEDIAASEPDACDSNEFDVKLTVTDCTAGSGFDSAVISVECCGSLPGEDTGKGK